LPSCVIEPASSDTARWVVVELILVLELSIANLHEDHTIVSEGKMGQYSNGEPAKAWPREASGYTHLTLACLRESVLRGTGDVVLLGPCRIQRSKSSNKVGVISLLFILDISH
jgi:hypothetical protein